MSLWRPNLITYFNTDDVGKTRTKSSTRQDGGDVDNSNASDVDDMDVSYDCELNLSTNFEWTSFEEFASCDEWKDVISQMG